MTESWTDCHFTHIQYILNRSSLCLVPGCHMNPNFHNRIKKKSLKASLMIQILGAYNSLNDWEENITLLWRLTKGKVNCENPLTEPQNLSMF